MSAPLSSLSEYLSPADVAAELGLSRSTVLRRIKRGDIAAIDVGRPSRPVYRIHRDALVVLARPVNASLDDAVAAAVAATVATAPALSADQIDTVAVAFAGQLRSRVGVAV